MKRSAPEGKSMGRRAWIGIVLFELLAARGAYGVKPLWCELRPTSLLDRLAPVGGWFPYGGGLLHWWPENCFPRCGGPDDYCRKSLPKVCWPACPSAPIAGPIEVVSPLGGVRPTIGQPQ